MKKVVIYTVDYCPYCKKAKQILSDKNISFEEIDITENEDEALPELTKKTGIDTVPQIFIDDKFIGGCDTLSKLDASGELDSLLS